MGGILYFAEMAMYPSGQAQKEEAIQWGSHISLTLDSK